MSPTWAMHDPSYINRLIRSSSGPFFEHFLMQSKVKAAQSCRNSLRPHGLHSPWNSQGQNTGVDNCSLLQGIFPTRESNAGLPHHRRILYQLSHKGTHKS